jgi:poly(A) polymerase
MAGDPGSEIKIPEPVAALGERVGAAGGELYIVGGWVRDAIRGVPCRDIDLATSLPTAAAKRALAALGSVYDLGEKFGTVGATLWDYTLEVTTFREEEYTPGSRHPSVRPAAGILEDLARRDFTINAVAVPVVPRPGRLIDPFDGQSDIWGGVIRTPGDPVPRMAEDPLRMMRAVRFAAQLGYSIVPELLETLRSGAHLLDSISWERRRDELEKILVSPYPDAGVRLLVDLGLMEYVAPELAAMKGVEQPPAYHRADVLGHTLLTLARIGPDPLLRRAALFHDVGKPPAKITEPKPMFPEHDKVGEELTRKVMRRLRYSNEDIQKTAFLVRRHMRPIQFKSDWSDAAVRRLVRDCVLLKGDVVVVPLDAVVELARADILAGSLATVDRNLELLEELGVRITSAQAVRKVEAARSPLDGRELMRAFGRDQGPWIRAVKDHLAHLVIEGELDPEDKEGALLRAREWLEGESSLL